MRLYGLVQPGASAPALTAALDRLQNASSGASRATVHGRWIGPGVALGWSAPATSAHVGLSHAPSAAADDGGRTAVTLLHVGRPISPDVPTRDASTLLHQAFAQGGGRGLAAWEGHYAAVVWDPSSETLHLATDRLGMRPLCLAPLKRGAETTGLAFASSATALAAIDGVDTSPDELAWLECWTFSTMLGDATFWRGISRLPQGTVATWNARDGLSHDQHWRLESLRTDPSLARDDYLVENHRLFHRSMTMHLAAVPDPCLTLSAGFDSKRIAVSLHELGARPPTYTLVEPEMPYESRIAQALAEALEFPCSTMDNALTDDDCRDVDELTDYEAVDEAWWLPVLRCLPKEQPNINGIGGDVLVNGLFLNEARLDLVERPAELARHLAKPAFLDILEPQFRGDLWPQLIAHVTDQLEEIDDPRNRVTLWFFRNRTRRRIARCSYGILDAHTDTLSPFHEGSLVEQSVRLDPKHKLGTHPAGDILARCATAFEHLPTSHTPGIADDPRFASVGTQPPAVDPLLAWGLRHTAHPERAPTVSAYAHRRRLARLSLHAPPVAAKVLPRLRWMLLPLLARARWAG